MRLTFMRGIPGTGKTHIAQEFLRTAENPTVRVSLDDLRCMIGPYDNFTPDREKTVLQMQEEIVLRALKAGKDVIVDATHLHPKTPKKLATIIWENGLLDNTELVISDAYVSLETCKSRIQGRNAAGGYQVPLDVVDKMHRTLEQQKRKGLWTIASITAHLPKIEPVAEKPGLPYAYICDLDGTLADNSHRSPYDYDLLSFDSSFDDVWTVLQYVGPREEVIFLSGRPDNYQHKTEEWLKEMGFIYPRLYMRKEGDDRRDSIVKLELFNAHIRDNWNVHAAIDDRDRVVSLWRALGIRCWQVAEGDF